MDPRKRARSLMSKELTEQFLPALSPEARPRFEKLEDLEERLDALVRVAQEPWPGLSISAEQFVAYLAERLPGDVPALELLGSINASDLYIACACTFVDPQALRRFESFYISEPDRIHAEFGSKVLDRDDFRQVVWERILVSAENEQPRIASYKGRGRLAGWLRMAARRTLLNAIRDAGRKPVELAEDDLLSRMLSETDDARLALDKAQHREWFKEAFAEALASLQAQERNLLRYRFVEGLSMQEAARILGIHRVSTSRQLARIRQHLLEAVRKNFARRMGESDQELVKALAEVQSHLDLSLSRLLRN